MSSQTISARLLHTFRAFKHRNYRLFFTGQGISLIGTWMQQMALGWYVYRITNDPFLLGLVTFCNHAPSIIMPPFAGVIADRYNRKKILLVTQSLSMIQASLMAVTVYTGTGGIERIIMLALFLGCINAIDAPVRQTFVINLVHDREDLGNAIALNSVMFNLARLAGPSIAGFVISLFGEKTCMFMNAVSFSAVLFSLSAITYKHTSPKKKNKNGLEEFASGGRYAFGEPSIRNLLLIMAIISFMGFSYISLLPVLVRDVLNEDARILGFLIGGAGCGAIAGALYLASRKNVRGLVRVVGTMSFCVGILFVLFSFSRHFIISLVIIPFIGMSLMLVSASCNTIIQTIVDEKMRGRVMSIYMMVFMGLSPIGSLFLGWLAGKIGIQHVFLIAGSCCFFAAFIFFLKRKKISKAMHPHYIRLGLISEEE
jgi:MFS family permease